MSFGDESNLACLCVIVMVSVPQCLACRRVFNIEGLHHKKHMEDLKQNVLDGSSNWGAKITITGLFFSG